MRRLLIFASCLLVTSLTLAADKPTATVQLPPKPLLPQSFAGWTMVRNRWTFEAPNWILQGGNPLFSTRLAELGYRRSASADYKKNGLEISLDAYEFADASGAYGYYAGTGTTSISELTHHPDAVGEITLRSGDTVVMADFLAIEKDPVPGLHNDLLALAKTLPIPYGSKGVLPLLPQYLPKSGLDTASIQYALGPAGFSMTPSPLAGKLDFNTGAEVVVGQYGSGTLTLVEYPTPQMAIAQLKSIAGTFQLVPQKDLPDGLLGNTSVVAWRTGPIVALTSGMPPSQAVKLAAEVHYEAVYTIDNPHGYVSDAWRAAHLYLGIFALCGILCGAAVFLGLFFGGARAIIRVMRGKPASAVDDVEFLRLNIERPERNQPPPSQD